MGIFLIKVKSVPQIIPILVYFRKKTLLLMLPLGKFHCEWLELVSINEIFPVSMPREGKGHSHHHRIGMLIGNNIDSISYKSFY